MPIPPNHPIAEEHARRLIAGELGDVYRGILQTSCAPIYWYRTDCNDRSILHNGTVTFVKTSQRLLGITAAHVLREYLRDGDGVKLQIMNAVVRDMANRVICMSKELDIVTFAVDEDLLRRIGKEIVPLADWPPRPPAEGFGIMFAGYPGGARIVASDQVSFGLFPALVTARTVTDKQITWVMDRDRYLTNPQVPMPPPNFDLGGISGGPLISWFESEQHITTYKLSGIVIEHPDYTNNEFSIERVIAIRADFIQDSGRILGWRR